MNAPSILFRCDATVGIGGGHVMRCLTLAHALAARGCRIGFACAEGSVQVVRALDASGYSRIALDDPFDPDELAAKALDGYHTIVVDHYGLAQPYERALRRVGASILVIDDLVDRPHDCDMLVDQTFGRSHRAYHALIPPNAVALTGSTYAMVRPEFAAAREAALTRHRVGGGRGDVSRVLISLGLTDVGGISAQVAASLLALRPDLHVDVVIGAVAASRSVLESLARTHAGLRVHVDSTCMAQLVAAADLAIGAGGTTSWERCCLALPTVMLILADNQVEVGRSLEAAGAAVCAANATAAANTAVDLLDAPATRARMAACAAALVDGRGVERIVRLLLPGAEVAPHSERFTTSPATKKDAERIWLWRNDPQTRAVSLSSEPIVWDSHVKWLDRTLADIDVVQLVVSRDDEPVGTVRFARLDDGPAAALVSINLDPAWRGRGIGRGALAAAIEHHDGTPLADLLVADIALDNAGSIAIFEHCGFRRTGEAHTGRFARYARAKPPRPEAR